MKFRSERSKDNKTDQAAPSDSRQRVRSISNKVKDPTEQTTRRHLIVVSALVVTTTYLYYATVPTHPYYHDLLSHLFFMPLILAALWFGIKGALGFSLTVTLVNLPFMIANWHGLSLEDFNSILEVFLFYVVAGVLGALSDREKARQQALRESEHLAAMGRTLAGVAHDMKNPLAAIGGFTRLLRKKLDLNDDSRHKMDLITAETDRLEAMVNDMLDFARPLHLGLEVGDINDVLRRSLLLMEDQAEKRKVSLNVDLGADIPPLRFDPKRMEQVFLNLLSNALEASPEGEGVFVHTCLEGEQVCLEVADHGEGIPADQREKIFTPFFTTKRYGTGLGLAIVMKIMHAHKGKVEVRRTHKGGATFKISLPSKKTGGNSWSR